VMANVWMHNGFLQVEGQKMSKSLGNFITIHELLHTGKFGGSTWSGDALRIAMLRTHYRQPIDWTVSNLVEATQFWVSCGNVIRDYAASQPDKEFLEALRDDLNTPAAFAVLSKLRNAAAHGDEDGARALRASLEFLGLYKSFRLNFSLSATLSESGLSPEGIVSEMLSLNGDIELMQVAASIRKHGPMADASVSWLAKFVPGTTVRDFRRIEKDWRVIWQIDEKRQEARANKDWASSDRLRDELFYLGIIVKDSKDGSTWEVKR
jgi:cysteinyl-tRNA synthetase